MVDAKEEGLYNMNIDYRGYNESSDARINAFYSNLSKAVERADRPKKTAYESITVSIRKESNVLGLTMVPYDNIESFGMVSSYAAESTKENPIIRVSSNYGGEKRVYNVCVNEVNPSMASQLEMFALCSYTDDVGITVRGTFGTYSRMKTYAMNGYLNDTFVDLQNPNHVGNAFDWIKMLRTAAQQYLLNVQTYNQYLDANGLADTFTNWKNKSYAIGAQTYTLQQWDKLIQRIDHAIEDIVQEQKEYLEDMEEERLNCLLADRSYNK